MSKCKLCREETKVIFNINFKAVSVCQRCANRITIQNVNDHCPIFLKTPDGN